MATETVSVVLEQQSAETPAEETGEAGLASDSSAHGAEMLIRLKEGVGFVYPVPQGYIAEIARAEGGNEEGTIVEAGAGQTDEVSEATQEPSTRNSVAIQANDYEIERRSGVLPARRRLIPFKFRDFQNPEDLDGEDPGDEDYDPEEVQYVKRPRKTTPRPGGRGVGRPRKVRKDHAYDRTGETKADDENNGETVGESTDTETTAEDKTKRKVAADRPFPRRGRPPKDDPHQQPKIFRCLQCDKKFSLKGNLKVHMRTHTDERPFQCELADCGKSFRSNESLRRHNLSHQGIKLFGCDICKKRFSSNVALKEHMARHTDTKSHVCHVCQRAFRQLSCLRRHLTTHSEKMPHQCTLCEKRFSQAVYLRSHMRSHTGERPYRCDTCGKCFAHQSDRMRHMTIHLGTKPYVCEVCEARFSDPSTRRRHVREHTGFKPYTCQLCGDNFKRSGQLKAHLNKKHMNYKEEVVITKEGPFNSLQFQFKGNKDTGVAEQLQAEQLAASAAKTKYVQQVVAAPSHEGQVITIAPGQDNIQLIDEHGHIQHVQVQHMEQVDPNGQPPNQNQVQMQQQLAQSGLSQSPMEGYQIILPQGNSGNQEELLEETQKIIQQIQSQFDVPSEVPGGQQVKVAYQILHDDDNQQIVEIQYHPVEQEEVQPQGVVTFIENQDESQMQSTEEQTQDQLQLQQKQMQEEQLQHNQLQEQLQQEQLHQEQLQQEQIQQEQLQQGQIEVHSVEFMEAPQHLQEQQQNANAEVMTLEQLPPQVQLAVKEHESTREASSSELAATLQEGSENGLQQDAPSESQVEADQAIMEAQSLESNILERVSQQSGVDEAHDGHEPDQEHVAYELEEVAKTKPEQMETADCDGVEQDLGQDDGGGGDGGKHHQDKVVDSLLALQSLEQQQQQASVDFVTNPDFGSQKYYNWLSSFTELCKLVPIPLDVDLFQKISQVHKTLSDVLATPRGILTNRENFRTLMNISKELNGIINEHLNFVLHNLDTDIDIE